MSDLSNAQNVPSGETLMSAPDKVVKVRELFGVDSDMEVPAFSEADERVPDLDPAYVFDPDTTLAICAGFARNRRVMVQGYHGTGKSTHIEQVAARLKWPCIRINLDAHISRIDLIGRDAIVLRDGQQVTEFREGLLPWALQHPVALVFDEYDAGRPDVMFVIQRVLEVEGKLTLLDQNRVIRPNPFFRQLGTEHAHLRRCRLRFPSKLPQQVRRGGAAADCRILSARVRQGPAGERSGQGLGRVR